LQVVQKIADEAANDMGLMDTSKDNVAKLSLNQQLAKRQKLMQDERATKTAKVKQKEEEKERRDTLVAEAYLAEVEARKKARAEQHEVSLRATAALESSAKTLQNMFEFSVRSAAK
jgi:hypothetical protein